MIVSVLMTFIASLLAGVSTNPLSESQSSWEELEISPKRVGVLEFRQSQIRIYQDSGSRQSRDSPDHSYYFTPMVLLDHMSAQSYFNTVTIKPEMSFTIQMWNEQLRQAVSNHLKEQMERKNVELHNVHVLPFDRVILTKSEEWDTRYKIPETWCTYNLGKVVKYHINCQDINDCDRLAQEMKTNPQQFASLTMKYSFASEKSQRREIKIEVSHLRSGRLFSRLSQKFPESDTVLLTAAEKNALLAEASSIIIVNTFDETTEIVAANGRDQVYAVLESLIIHGQETVNEQKTGLWESVFWDRDNYRPDKASKTINKIFMNSDKAAQQKLIKLFSSSSKTPPDVWELFENSDLIRNRENSSKYNQEDMASSGKSNSHVTSGFIFLKSASRDSEAQSQSSSDIQSNSSDNDKLSATSGSNNTFEIASNGFSASRNREKEDLLRLLAESKEYVEWNGEKFIPKPMDLSRLNLAAVKSKQNLVEQSTFVSYWTAVLWDKVNIEETYNSDEVKEMSKRLKRSFSRELESTISSRSSELTSQVKLLKTQMEKLSQQLDSKILSQISEVSSQVEHLKIQIEGNQGQLTQRFSNHEKLFNSTVELLKHDTNASLRSFFRIVLSKEGERNKLFFNAAETGDEDFVRSWLHSGLSLNEKDRNDYGRTALHKAAKNGRTKIVGLLISGGADVRVTDNDGSTPLHSAAYKSHKEIVEQLIKVGAKINEKNVRGETPLHWAANNVHKEILELLIKAGANVNERSNSGWTPLHLAASWGGTAVVKALLQSGANKAIVNNSKETARDLALAWGRTELAKLL